MDGLASFHLIALGSWAGVVLTELVFEAGGISGKLDRGAVAWLHWQVDRFVEIPLLVAVLASGTLLWRRAGWSPELAWKVAFGVLAVTANLFCVFVVRRRVSQPESAALTHSVIGSAVVGIPLGLVALVLGGARVGWW